MVLSPDVIASIITLIGVIVTVYISFRATRRQLGLELQKMKQENKLAYTNHLLEKRVDKYPLLYGIISSYQNQIRSEGINLDNLKKLYEDLMNWDVENAIYTSSKMKFVLFDLFKVLRVVIYKKSQKTEISYRKDIIEKLSRLELAMKSDLGVFLVEFPGTERGYFDSYVELNQVVNKVREEENAEMGIEPEKPTEQNNQ